MKKATRSILEELNNLNFNRNKEHLIETTGDLIVRALRFGFVRDLGTFLLASLKSKLYAHFEDCQ